MRIHERDFIPNDLSSFTQAMKSCRHFVLTTFQQQEIKKKMAS
jgi:hypothetical protein